MEKKNKNKNITKKITKTKIVKNIQNKTTQKKKKNNKIFCK